MQALFISIFYGSFLIFPFLLYLLWKWKKGGNRFIIGLLAILSLVFVWARFVEPQIILVEEHKIPSGFSAKVLLISDLHLGVFKDQDFLDRVVKKIENENPEVVLIAGDFVFYPPDNLEELFSPLKEISVPIFAVLGNHDAQIDNPKLPREDLIKALKKNSVIVLNNDEVKINNFILLGLGSQTMGQDKTNILNKHKEREHILVLTHNPDTTANYPPNKVDYTLAGHTHGGQIRLPYLYQKMIPTKGDFDRGIYDKMLISSGLGEVFLPMRFLIPPQMEMIYFY